MTREIVQTGKQDWTTPRALWEALHAEFTFDVDLFAAEYNAHLPLFYGPGSTVSEDALTVSWAGTRGWANPPYGDLDRCLRYAVAQAREGAFSVWLVPANTDTRWFHEFAVQAQVDFFRGRISFEDRTPAHVEAGRLFRVVEAYSSPNAPGFQKSLQSLGKVLRQLAMEVGGLEGAPAGSPLETAMRKLDRFVPEWREFSPAARAKPGPGFPSMLLTFDPARLGATRPFRTRDAKTGKLL